MLNVKCYSVTYLSMNSTDATIPNLPMDSANPSVENSPSKTMATSSSTDASYYSAASNIDGDGQKDSNATLVQSRSDERFQNGQRPISTAKSSDAVSHKEKSQNTEKTTIEISANSPPKISFASNSYLEPRDSPVTQKPSGMVEHEYREERVGAKSEQIVLSDQTDSSNTGELTGREGRGREAHSGGKATVTEVEEITNDEDELVGINCFI